MAYPMVMIMNLVSTIVLGLQTFDMGLITDNCGDVEVCVPHVKPIALAGWVLVAGSVALLIINSLMLSTYWQFSTRLLDEEDCGYTSSTSGTFMHSHTHHHHQYSHQNYPINYSSGGGAVNHDIEAAFTKGNLKSDYVIDGITKPDSILRTPQPKRSAKNLFNDAENEFITLTKTEASKLTDLSAYYHHQYRIYDGEVSASSSTTSSSNDYKSLQISPLDFSQLSNKGVY